MLSTLHHAPEFSARRNDIPRPARQTLLQAARRRRHRG
jgi:hypothetical protein